MTTQTTRFTANPLKTTTATIQFDDNDDAKRQWNTALDNGHVLIADVNDIPVAIKEIVSLENGTVTFKHGRITKSDINIVALCIKVNGYISIQGPYGEMRIRRFAVSNGSDGFKKGTWISDHRRGTRGYIGWSKPAHKQEITEAARMQLSAENVERVAREFARAKASAY